MSQKNTNYNKNLKKIIVLSTILFILLVTGFIIFSSKVVSRNDQKENNEDKEFLKENIPNDLKVSEHIEYKNDNFKIAIPISWEVREYDNYKECGYLNEANVSCTVIYSKNNSSYIISILKNNSAYGEGVVTENIIQNSNIVTTKSNHHLLRSKEFNYANPHENKPILQLYFSEANRIQEGDIFHCGRISMVQLTMYHTE